MTEKRKLRCNRRKYIGSFSVAAFMIALTTILLYLPTVNFAFVHLDDPDYVWQNRYVHQGISWRGIWWALSSFHAGNWHPLTWISHMLDVQIYGLNPGGHHVTNFLFHSANSVLLLLLFHKMTNALWRSAILAAIFALHPLRVESVAWIAERKDVLSTFFLMLTLITYVRYVKKSEDLTSKDQIHSNPSPLYFQALILFILGLMCKPMLVTLPFLLLLLDMWPLNRLDKNRIPHQLPRQLLLEKIPFFVLSLISSIITFFAQKSGNAVVDISVLPIKTRVANACVSYTAYLSKIFWPQNLAPLYPMPPIEMKHLAISLIVLGAITIALLSYSKRFPYLRVGWLWYLGTLVPVIGIIQVGSQLMADRYTYIPQIGITLLSVWGIGDIVKQFQIKRALSICCIFTLFVCLCVLSWAQIKAWRNSECLFKQVIRVNGESPFVLVNLGNVFAEKGNLLEAVRCYEKSLKIKPTVNGFYNLGVAQAKQRDFSSAIQQFRHALELNPNWTEALNNLAWLLATAPESENRNGLEAIQIAERACDLKGTTEPQLWGTLAAAYAEVGRFSDAVNTARKAQTLALEQGESDLAEQNEALLALYESNRSYHQESR